MRILLVATNPDFEVKEGGTRASRDKLIQLLARNNYLLFLNASRGTNSGGCLFPNRRKGHEIYHFRQWSLSKKPLALLTDFNLGFLTLLKRIIAEEDIDLVCITEPFGIISASIIQPRVPIIYDAHDVSSDHALIGLRRLEMDHRIFRFPVLREVFKMLFVSYMDIIERLACRRAKHIIAISETDRRRFIQKYHLEERKVTSIPIWVTSGDAWNQPPSTKRARDNEIRVVFHGSYRHAANYEAAMMIRDYIAPEVSKRDNRVKFIMAGTDMPRFKKGNVVALGYVKNLSRLLRSCDIAVVPILRGTGVRIKIFDYMASGLPVVTTEEGIKGIEAVNGKHAIIVDKVDRKFVDAIMNLVDDGRRRQELRMNAFELLRTKYNRDIIQAKIDKILATMVNAECQTPPQTKNVGQT